MNAWHPAATPGSQGLGTMLRVLARIQLRSALVWVLGLGASMIGTAAGIASLYDSPAKIHSYAAAVTAGNALLAINGKVQGIDSLGGVIADEFGFIAAFLLPLLGISLVARATRREEESGRLELLLGGPIARHLPTLAALAVTTAAIGITGALFAAALIGTGVPVARSILYAAALGCLAFAFAGVAALLAQLTLHARGVYTWSLIILAVSYLLRGVGDVTGSWITWLSPLGWAEKAAPFGHQRWWAIAVPIAVGLALGVVALRLAAGRDLGSALIRSGPGRQHAGARLRNPLGLAVWIHRPATLGWLTGGVLLTAMMGALSQQIVDAMAGNPALTAAMGITNGRPIDGSVAAVQLYLAVIASGYVVHAIGTLRVEEADGRLETRLCGTLSRTRWLASHALVVLGGLLTIMLGSSLVLGLATAMSVGDTAEIGPTLRSGLAYLPAELVLAGLALAVYGLRPRLFGFAWASYAVMTFIAFLGPGLHLRQWALDISPTTHVGNPPANAIQTGALTVMTGAAVTLVAVGLAAFRRRDIPQS